MAGWFASRTARLRGKEMRAVVGPRFLDAEDAYNARCFVLECHVVVAAVRCFDSIVRQAFVLVLFEPTRKEKVIGLEERTGCKFDVFCPLFTSLYGEKWSTLIFELREIRLKTKSLEVEGIRPSCDVFRIAKVENGRKRTENRSIIFIFIFLDENGSGSRTTGTYSTIDGNER